MFKTLFFLISTFFSFGLYAQVTDWVSGGKLKPEQAVMDIRHYTLKLNVDPSTKTISGSAEIDLMLTESTPILLFDFVSFYKISEVTINGKKVPYSYESDFITIKPATALPAGKVKVTVKYSGQPPVAKHAPWDGGFQWSKDSGGNDWIAITCQSEGAKIYFPSKDHPSDEPNEGVDLFITVPKGLVAAGPGLLQKTTHGKTTSTFHWKTNYTINTYSIVFNVGKYKAVTRPYKTIAGNTVPMIFYVLEEHADKAPHHLEILEKMTRVLEKYFGEYPWVKEKIGLAETPHLGMEHQTLNAYGNHFGYTKLGGEDFDWLMAHEFGHEWWANKVTGKNYSDMWIQEGICTFGDHLQIRDREGEEAYRAKMRATGRATQNLKPVVPGKDANSVEVYHGDIYGKGAFFMHTIRYLIGDSIFFPTLRTLATSPDYTYDKMPDTDDVEKLFSTASGKNLKPVFDFFLRTVNKLEIGVKQVSDTRFSLRLLNYNGSLPVEVKTDKGIIKSMVSKEGVIVESGVMPQIDITGYYIKKVILEY
ncbi:M1 family metallopeptidase [Flavitalea sp.]|nr:M1 family metallopeptidase [Flavitalea sp.]